MTVKRKLISIISLVMLLACVFAFSVCSRPTEGLSYELTDDGKAYEVAGIGTTTGTTIVIPETYNGLPVVKIGDNAFKANISMQYDSTTNSMIQVLEDNNIKK